MNGLNRWVAFIVATLIVGSISMFAYGLSITTVEQYFSFEVVELMSKTLLGFAMAIIIFFSRPRWIGHRILLGAIATSAIVCAAYSAAINSLLIGDAIIYCIGALVAALETTEVRLPRGKSSSEIHIPVIKTS